MKICEKEDGGVDEIYGISSEFQEPLTLERDSLMRWIFLKVYNYLLELYDFALTVLKFVRCLF